MDLLELEWLIWHLDGMMGGATTSPWQNATPAQKNSTNNTTSTETWECPNCKNK